jgi:hypothetical protein
MLEYVFYDVRASWKSVRLVSQSGIDSEVKIWQLEVCKVRELAGDGNAD